jgi:hypothetical protein
VHRSSRVLDSGSQSYFEALATLCSQVAGLMIAAELAERRLVQPKQYLAQLLGFKIAGCETLSVNLTLRVDEGVSVFGADLAVLVVETCLAHAALLCSARNQPISSSPGTE